MGFYGNITNTSRTTFQFDRIYSCRQAMDDNCANDGIYAGRYVLVEYDTQLSSSDYDKGYYLVTDTTGKHIPYGSVNCCSTTNNYLYFSGPVETTRILASDLANIQYKVIYFDAHRHFTFINNTPIYIKLKRNGSYVGLTWEQFRNHYEYQGSETNITNSTPEQLEAQDIVHAHIANGVAHIENTSLFKNENTEVYAVVLPKANYTYNVDPEFWTIEDSVFQKDGYNYSYLSQIPNDASGNYSANFNIDKGRYRTARGYDSTVWQKVYQNGVEKYVMIAELNTIIPTFGVTADPPSLLPISPHFGADSTNAYYELHWQPSWGFRVKAANNILLMPKVQPNGQLDLFDSSNISNQAATIRARSAADDNIYYPSDQQVTWKQTFEDNTLNHDDKRKTLYYNSTLQKWENDTAAKVPAAIYFNRSGFNSDKIAYSSDLNSEDSRTSYPPWNRYNASIATSGWTNEDNISLTPTGYSGNVYNLHDGSIDLKPQPDTQELSIMLPSIGDTMANVWDLVYGGRNTTSTIRETNYRNKEIAWEDAKGEPARRGLRLTGLNGDEYNKKQVDTLAGAINTAHDLIGMIISPNTAAELQDTNNLDSNRIYYDTTNNNYLRKHKTYTYNDLTSNAFEYIRQTTSNLNQEKINSGLYYEYVNGQYRVATVYNSSKSYYLKQAKPQYSQVRGTVVDFPYSNYKWYQDYLGENSKIIQDIMNNTTLTPAQKQQQIMLKSDYILNANYQEGRDYYRITEQEVTLQQDYKPGLYWYKETGTDSLQFKLDNSPTKTPDRTYYTLNLQRLEASYRLKGSKNYKGIYVPGKYSFKKRDGSYEVDLTTDQTCNGELARGNVELVNPDTDPTHNGQFKYYILDVLKTYDTNGQEILYRRVISYNLVSNLTAETFIDGVYYIKTYDTNNQPIYQLAPGYDSNITEYYLQQINYIKIEDTSQVEIKVSSSYYRDELVVYNVGMYFLKNINNSGETIGFQEITRSAFVNDPNIIYKEVYIFGDKETNTNPPFLTLDEAIAKNDIIKRQDSFYQENTYHFKRNGSYILDTSTSMTTGRQYFLITPTKLTASVTYYVPNKYYIREDGEEGYTLAITPQKPNTTLYERQDLYVKSDTRKILSLGMKWNQNAAAIPNEVTLATRKEVWETSLMPNYSTSMGTLNGMILKMYQILEPYDTLTRANDNVSGVLNQIKDILARFETMKSQEVMIVDNYGRAHSAAIGTSQVGTFDQIKETDQDMIDSITKDRFPQVANVGAMAKRWITVNVDGDPNQPIFTIHHNFQPVAPTTSSFNFNNEGDTIDIITPIVDAMGHTVGTDTKTVTLPYSFKTFTISNEDTDNAGASTTAGSGGSIVADNVKDTFIFKTSNKWLRFVTDTENDTLTIAHKIHTMTAEQSQARATNKNADNVASNSDNDKLVLHDIVWDDAAHMLEDHPHTYTLPYGFKFIATGAASDAVTDLVHAQVTIAAESTQDTVTFNTANKWIKLSANATDDSITFGHLVDPIDEVANSASDLNISIGESIVDLNNKISIKDINYDLAGHITEFKDHIYTLPYGYKFVTTSGTFGDTTSDGTASLTTNVHSTNITAIALNTQDTLTIDPGNAWIKINVNQNDRKVSLYHCITAIDEEAVNSGTATDFNNISNGQFSLKDITHDDAGHITAYKTHNYVLPFGFKTLSHSNSDSVTDINFGNNYASPDIIAETVTDTLTLASQNKWIRLLANAETDTLTIAHLVNNVTLNNGSITPTSDLSSNSINTDFTVIDSLTVDEAGHITAFSNRKYTMPNGFGTITITSSTSTDELTSNTTGIAADCTYDGLTFAEGDRWIHIAGNDTTDTITIGHASPGTVVSDFNKGQNSAETLNYGGSFKVVHPQADKFGHMCQLDEYTITIPSISLTTSSTGTDATAQVLTDIGLTTTTGAFTYSKANVGSLALTGWAYDSNANLGDLNLTATDTILQGLIKLQRRIINEETNRASAISALDHSVTGETLGTGNTITALTQVDGKVSYTVSAISITSSQVFDLGTTISNAINDLDVNNTIGTNEVHLMKTLSETNGKISYTSEKLAWSHISALLPTGNNAFLTVGTAASTYQPIGNYQPAGSYLTTDAAASTYQPKGNYQPAGNYQAAGNYAIQDDEDLYIKNSDLESALTNNVYTDTTFLWAEEVPADIPNGITGSPEERKTIDQLITYIKVLEQRIYNLENPEPEPEPGE